MTTDERAFLDAICAQPDDDTARLVYADWLAENGQPDRGEFIRAEIELANTPPTTEADERRRRVLLDRRAVLLKKHKAVWLAPFLPFAKESDFDRGFVRSVDVPANTFLQQAEKWFGLTPLTRVKITTCYVWDQTTASRRWWVEPLFASPHLARLEALDLETLELTADDIGGLVARDLPRLRELVLRWNGLRSPGAAALAGAPGLCNLRVLDLRSNSITDAGGRAIAESEYLNGLLELRMTRNPIRNRCWQLLEERFGHALVG
jgi:uncharacterized protein (TIGR02996 family)